MTWAVLVVVTAGVLVIIVVLVRIMLVLDAMKTAAAEVAANLAIAQREVDGVATDLAQGHVRANDAVGPHGAAADAAARSGGGDGV